ncbi:IS5 family transposase [bacterium]
MIYELSLFKELNPYSGKIDENNRWIKLANLVPWENLNVIYQKYFAEEKIKQVKKCRLILGLMLGQILIKLSDRDVLDYFHENPYFQYFCGCETFVVKLEKSIIHYSLLSKRRKKLGKKFFQKFQDEVIKVLIESKIINPKTLILDATVEPSNIEYPNDVKLMNVAREYLCKKIIEIKNLIDVKKKVRTYKILGRKVFLNFQKKKQKTRKEIKKAVKTMHRYLKRNIKQIEDLLKEYAEKKQVLKTKLKKWEEEKLRNFLGIAKNIYEQQKEMIKENKHSVKERIVSFHQPEVRPIVRGKEGKKVEFGPKLHVCDVDGYAILDELSNEAFHEGNLYKSANEKHKERFGKYPKESLGDGLYGTLENRRWAKENGVETNFKVMGRSDKKIKKRKKKLNGKRNRIEGDFGTLKEHFKMNKIVLKVKDGASIQCYLSMGAMNLTKAMSRI